MALHLPTFLTRFGSSIVFAVVMMAGLLWKDWAFIALMILIQFLCIQEFFKLVNKIIPGPQPSSLVQRMTQAFSFVFTGLLGLSVLSTEIYYQADLWPAALCLPAIFLLLIIFHEETFIYAALKAFGGMAYITLPIALMVGLRGISPLIPVALILMIWTNDTMAYLTGSFFGKTPFSKISPKKTWEGTIGGIVLTVAGAAIWGYFSPWYTVADWVALAIITGAAATAGDLLESKLKRLADVKDSGSIMPGHGGALDRFDSLLLTAPFAFAYAFLFMPELALAIF